MNSETSATAPNDPRGRGSGVGGERLNAPFQAKGTTSKPGPGAGDKPAEHGEPSAQGAEGAGPSPHAEPRGARPSPSRSIFCGGLSLPILTTRSCSRPR